MYIHVAAVAAYLQSSGRLPVNVKFMLEGEEEIGSPNLGDFVEAHRELFQCDAAVISDTPMANPQTPVIVTGVRGLIYMEITLRGSRQDLHSGGYGGVVENPLNALCQMLASLRDENGTITIPGFYDNVHDLTPAERDALNTDAVNETQILTERAHRPSGARPSFQFRNASVSRPTLDIHGIKGGFIGAGSKTVIPPLLQPRSACGLYRIKITRGLRNYFEPISKRFAPPTMEVSIKGFGRGGAGRR